MTSSELFASRIAEVANASNSSISKCSELFIFVAMASVIRSIPTSVIEPASSRYSVSRMTDL